LKLPFDSDEAKKLNREIFETIYFAAMNTSCELAKKYGPYESYKGSPMSLGQFQFNLWDVEPDGKHWCWGDLQYDISKFGVRNSVVTACMPTASTSQILGNNEAFEPITSNIYVRRTLAGEFICINKYLLKDLIDQNLWNDSLKNKLIQNNGSIQNIKEISNELKLLYRTVWEIPQKEIVNMSADRAPFIDQTQSLNIHMKDCTHGKLSSMHFYGWKKGLKTGLYYLRTKPATDALKFTIEPEYQVCEPSCGDCGS